jgi:hypothetical protein
MRYTNSSISFFNVLSYSIIDGVFQIRLTLIIQPISCVWMKLSDVSIYLLVLISSI